MEEKAETFLRGMAKRFAGHKLDDGELEDIFDEVIASLPEKKKKLKRYLTQTASDNLQKFICFFKDAEAEKSLFLQASPPTIVQSILMNAGDGEKLNNVLNEAFESCSGDLTKKELASKLIQLAVVAKSTALQCIANALYSYFEKELENLTQQKAGANTMIEFKDIILKTAIALQNKTTRNTKNPANSESLSRLTEILSALFSMYIEVSLIVEKSNFDKKQCINLGHKLIETGSILMGNVSSKLLESLVQVSSSQQANAKFILKPMYNHVLLQQNFANKEINVLKYLQYMLATRQGMLILQDSDEKLSKNFCTSAMQVSAPATFYKWVVDRVGGNDLLDITPIMPATKPAEVTKYFVKEAEMEILEDFLDLYHADLVADIAAEDEVKKEEKDTDETEFGFFIDKGLAQNDDEKLTDQEDVLDAAQFSDDNESDDELLKETEHLLDSSDGDTSSDEEASKTVPENINPDNCSDTPMSDDDLIIKEEYIDQSEDVANNNDELDQSQKRKSCEPIKNKTPKKLKSSQAKDCLVFLSPIMEDVVQESKTIQLKDLPSSVKPRRNKSDSESSTGSHGYMTRSRMKSEI